MKKALVILFALCMVGAAFAEEATFDGSATLTFGYDLEDSASGFTNAAAVTVTVPILAEGTKATEGEGMYGELKIEHFGIQIDQDMTGASTLEQTFNDDDDATAVSAKIVMDPLYVQVYNLADLGINLAEKVGTTPKEVSLATAGTGGVEVGYTSDLIELAFKTNSQLNWGRNATYGDDVATSNVDNDYYFGVSGTLNAVPDMVSVDFGFSKLDLDMGFGFGATITMDALEVFAGADVVMYDEDSALFTAMNEGMEWDFVATATYNMGAENEDGDFTNFAVKANAAGSSTKLKLNMPLDVLVSFTELDGDDGIVPALGLGVSIGIMDILDAGADIDTPDDAMYFTVDVNGTYVVQAGLTPGFGVTHNTLTEVTTLYANLELGSDFTTIENTTFLAEYRTPLLAKNAAGAAADAGFFTIAATIEF